MEERFRFEAGEIPRDQVGFDDPLTVNIVPRESVEPPPMEPSGIPEVTLRARPARVQVTEGGDDNAEFTLMTSPLLSGEQELQVSLSFDQEFEDTPLGVLFDESSDTSQTVLPVTLSGGMSSRTISVSARGEGPGAASAGSTFPVYFSVRQAQGVTVTSSQASGSLSRVEVVSPVDICARTPVIRDAILAEVAADDCARVSGPRLRGVTGLDLSSTGITLLRGDDFSELTGLQTLDLSGNQLSELSADVFSSLGNLQSLNLAGNRLNELPSRVFSSLGNLQRLNVAGNRLNELSAGVFSGLSSLTGVDLSGNPGSTFTLTVQLELMSPGGVDSRTIPGAVLGVRLREGAPREITGRFSVLGGGLSPNSPVTILRGGTNFAGGRTFTVTIIRDSLGEPLRIGLSPFMLGGSDADYPGIEIVLGEVVIGGGIDICGRTSQVRDAILAEVAADACDDVPRSQLRGITELDLSSTGITLLKRDDFSELAGLGTLSLSGNALEALPDRVFRGLDSLQTLDLSGNRVTTLTANVFSDLSSLQTLDLSGNRVATLTANVFSGLSSLRTLNLSGNQLDALPAGVFAELVELTGVDLSGNPGSTFTLMVEMEFDPPLQEDQREQEVAIRLTLREGAPRNITGNILVSGGESSNEGSVRLGRGVTRSGPLFTTLSRDRLDEPTILSLSLAFGGSNADYPGIEIVPGASVTLGGGDEDGDGDGAGLLLRIRVFLEGALE